MAPEPTGSQETEGSLRHRYPKRKETLMDDITRINDLLAKYPEDIYKATQHTENLREEWQLADARRDYEFARHFLQAKLSSLTEGQAKAKAVEETRDTSMAVVMAEATYRRALADQIRIENEFTAARKQANLLEITIQHSGRVA
jgi:hypothetical protein